MFLNLSSVWIIQRLWFKGSNSCSLTILAVCRVISIEELYGTPHSSFPVHLVFHIKTKEFLPHSPGEIKRREVSWTHEEVRLLFAGPGEIKTREVVLDPPPRRDHEQGGGAGLRKLDFFCFSCSSTAVLRTLSLWLCTAQQLKQQLRSTLVAAQWRDPRHCLNIVCCSGGGPRPPRSFRVGVRGHASKSFSLPHRPVPVPNKPYGFCGR